MVVPSLTGWCRPPRSAGRPTLTSILPDNSVALMTPAFVASSVMVTVGAAPVAPARVSTVALSLPRRRGVADLVEQHGADVMVLLRRPIRSWLLTLPL